MWLLVGALVLVLVLGVGMWITVGLIGLMLTLFVAGLIGWAADAVIPGRLPGGWLGAILAGIVGGFLGQLILGSFGPAIFGVRVIPAFAGAVAIAIVAELVTGSRARAQLR
jgi:uncharacterized membrane protein YeaQ/YmgE (transglycosylase-associated protein family)